MGKKKKQTTGPSKYSKPYIDKALSTTQNTVAANQPHLDQISGGLRDLYGEAQDRYMDSSGLDAAQGYNQDVLGGKYLDAGNPYLQGMIDRTSGDVSDRVNAIFGSAGRTGSGAHGEGLGRGLADSELGLRYDDYSSERDRMAQATSQSPALEAAKYAGLGAVNQTAANAAQLPYLGANMLAQNTQGLVGNYNTTTQKQGLGNTLGGLVGSGLAGWASGGFG